MRYFTGAVLAAMLAASVAFAQPPMPVPEPLPLPLPAPMPKAIPLKVPKANKVVEQPKPEEVAAIIKLMREMLLQKMPDPLVKANDGWGKQKEYAVGRVMLRRPETLPDAPRERVNDGLWRRFAVTARDPEKTLGIGFEELTRTEPDTLVATINVVMDINFRVEHQLWKRGLQIYTGETRGHCKAGVQLKVTVKHKTEFKPGSLFPDVALKITTTDAKLFYDKLVIDHTAGLDGADAKAMGDFVIDTIKSVKPELEKQLLEKANAEILKAAGTKEVKLQLDKLIGAGLAPKK
jgi:hypothetical protein